MDTNHRLSRTVICVFVVLAVLSVGGNAIVIRYLKTTVSDQTELVSAVMSIRDDVAERLSALEETVNSTQAIPALASVQPAPTPSVEVVYDNGPILDRLDELELQLSRLEGLIAPEERAAHPNPTPVIATSQNPAPLGNTGVRFSVLAGDTVWDIARRFGDPPTASFIERILKHNQITDPRKLRIGQVLVIPE